METIEYNGRTFIACRESEHYLAQIKWANKILDETAVTWPNGKDSHEVAGGVLENAEDALIDYLCIIVTR